MQVRQIALTDLKNRGLGDYSLADMKDPVKNIQAGTAYLQLRIDRRHGNVTDALNGYGTGKGYADNILAAEKALKESKTEDPMEILKRTIGE
jgi:soluble lytic murein transglycosylase-like protein